MEEVSSDKRGLFGKKLKRTNAEVVGFDLPSHTELWDTPRRGKCILAIEDQKVITCAIAKHREAWQEKNKRKNGFKFKYTTYQYFDFISYFFTLVILKIIKDESILNLPYKLGVIKIIKFKSNHNKYGRINLNLHSLRMKYKFLWSFGSIKSFRSYKLHRSPMVKYAIYNYLKIKRDPLNYFFHMVKENRKGAWVGAEKRDYDKLHQIIEKHYGISIFRPDTYRLEGRQ